MSWVRTVPPEAATGALAEFYDGWGQRLGFRSNFFEALSTRPTALIALMRFISEVSSGGSTLGRRKEELIATAVSAWNHNRYCLHGHGERLRQLAGDVADQVKADWRTADLEPDERAMLAFAEKLTLDRQNVGPADLDALRAAGFDDGEIVEIVLLVGLRHLVNIVGDGLGVEPFFAPKPD